MRAGREQLFSPIAGQEKPRAADGTVLEWGHLPQSYSGETANEGRSLLLVGNFSHADDLRGRTEFLVIAVSLLTVDLESLKQGDARVHLEGDMLGQPDFVVHSRLLQHKARAFVNPGQDPSHRHGVDRF